MALFLALNLTVAIGTLNGIIFYANMIVYANNSMFLLFIEPNFITAFISWLNLEIGFDSCFFVGLDAYSKTLLQLAFPAYVFFLVFSVIIISTVRKNSIRFSKIIRKHNPVATLATLISLSYAKLLHITIASLSFAILKYPDGSHTYVWLVDASVCYRSGKYIIIALLIIIAGVLYIALLLFWQWFLCHQDKTMFRWTKYQKLCHFIEPYHTPYTDKHRYWAGLLLLVRVILP